MKASAVWLVAVSLIALAAPGCYRPPAPVVVGTPCPPGSATYESRDVALRLQVGQLDGSYRLPLGKVVVSWSGVCAQGDALQSLGNQSSPASPEGNDTRPFRPLRIHRPLLTPPHPCRQPSPTPTH